MGAIMGAILLFVIAFWLLALFTGGGGGSSRGGPDCDGGWGM
jgi:hypothetical protein